MIHTEKVHVMFGLLAALGGACALRATFRPTSPTRLVWPVIAVVVGVVLFIPVEGHTLTYQEVGWWDTIRSMIPTDRANWIPNWIATLSVRHVLQHKIGGLCIIVMGAVEFLRGMGWLSRTGWGAVLPVMLAGAGLAFGIHGGSAEHLPTRGEQLHHWVFGAAFVAAGLSLGLARSGRLSGRMWLGAWAVLVMLVGLQIALLYRVEPPTGTEEHQHEGTGSGQR